MRDFHSPGRSEVLALNGMCATSHPLAAQAAISLLQAGGNAVDAAIGAAAVLSVCEPHMCGPGGDMFALVKPAGTEQVVGLNASGRAPAALSADALRAAGHRDMPLHDAAAVTLPGAVDGFCRLSERFGRLELAHVLAPAIAHAEQGVPVAPRVAFDWARVRHLQGAARAKFLPGGAPPKTGDIWRDPGLAEVLRRIATQGRAGFYEGEVAEDIIASLQSLGGVHTAEDLAGTRSEWTEPVRGPYRGVELIEHPPNGQGATAILMAAILSHFDLGGLDPLGAVRIHLEAEAARLAYDARNRFIADPSLAATEAMLDPATAARLAALIDPERARPDLEAAAGAVHRDTVYLCVVDADRMAVSLIYSIYHGFGSGLASERFGILFQNRGAGFNLIPGHRNEAAGAKRPMHTIIPGMIARDGRIETVFGVMGGAYQPAGHVRFLANREDFGMELQAAIDAPRSFPDGGVLQLERGIGAAVRADLAARGHRLATPEGPLGGAQAIVIRPDGVLEAGSDPRKDGCAIGF
ncbi:MAG: gamma-glutamyltransferase family protein [Alphaproteobacteria bacterium]|nr:MAG: gamma-glutamyltransferase family protein [Alphaproteobacteria bacterium]